MSFKQPDLTSGSRPVLAPDEALLFVQNNVGLYGGKHKITDSQVGHAYLTSHRACYVDDKFPRENSIAIDLKDVEKHEYSQGFLTSSAKITLHPKSRRKSLTLSRSSALSTASKQRVQASSSPGTRTASPFRPQIQKTAPPVTTGSWTCPICFFSNPLPSNFDATTASEATVVPPCLTCGIAPPFATVLKAAIAAKSNHNGSNSTSLPAVLGHVPMRELAVTASDTHVECSKCTFHNHPSLQICELCGAPLPRHSNADSRFSIDTARPESPAPEIAHLSIADEEDEPSIKFSFRSGGDKIFYEKLKSAMLQRKWLATGIAAPNPLNTGRFSEASSPTLPSARSNGFQSNGKVGIGALESRRQSSQNNNELVIGAAFEDIEALMALDKQVVAMTRQLARDFGNDALDSAGYDAANETDDGLLATKDMLSNTSDKLYISELSRNLAEYVTDDRRGVLRKQGGTMSLIDLWALFNRSRDGVELVSPTDFHKAANLWSELNLPVRLRQFRSGLLAFRGIDMTDERIVDQLRRWLTQFKAEPLTVVTWDWQKYGCGVTAQDAAQKFGWSLGIASEELEMAEERGALVREESIEGLKFWLNAFDEADDDNDEL